MKTYNEKKICFIICANNNLYLDECLLYLSCLEIPSGFDTELLVIEDAKSMTSGYNEGMNSSDAKYKIYIHQDTFVINTQILEQLIKYFQSDKNIGMIGVAGAEKVSKTAVVSLGEMCGSTYKDETDVEEIVGEYKVVDVVDGFFMATQYDLQWREDIVSGWEFYDTSQSLEFKKAGYRVIIPAQDFAWAIHVKSSRKETIIDDVCRNRVIEEYCDIIQPYNRLRILFIHSDMIIIGLLMVALVEMGHEVIEFKHKVKIASPDIGDQELVEKELTGGYYDLVMTYDFVESVSQACQNVGVKYCAWVYDSPLLNLYTTDANNSVNYICVFDRKQYERLQNRNYKHLAYFPLAAGTSWFGSVNISEEDEALYSAEVTFVGNLYAKRGFDTIFKDAPQNYIYEAERIVAAQGCEWDGTNKLFGMATDGLIDFMISKERQSFFEKYDIDKRYYCESVRLAGKCNEFERISILNEIANKYQVVLYTNNLENERLSEKIEIKSAVGYATEMPKIFYLSKINLNISSRSIESGIPQRVWDIMAVGGFCLTNYQPELEEFFEIGKDIEVYHNKEEMIAKIEYYLKNETARLRIAINGYKKVRKYHSYEKRMADVFAWVFQEE